MRDHSGENRAQLERMRNIVRIFADDAGMRASKGVSTRGRIAGGRPRELDLKQMSVERMQSRGASFSAVIAGLDPAIHLFSQEL